VLVNLYLIFGDHIPRTRPESGAISDLWDPGEAVGSTALFGVVTFGAYLLGSLLEIDPQSDLGKWLATRVRPSREFLLSRSSIADLLTHVRRNGGLPRGADDNIVARIGSIHDVRHAELELVKRISDELPQIATRLHVSNADLYGKYDRLLAEASLRINLTLPLSILFILVIVLSNVGPAFVWLAFVITSLIGVLILRQGVTRLVDGRDVIVQSLVSIDGIQSRSIDDYSRQYHDPEGEFS
jgi:hypothetical protein